ncbi:serine/threonine-protein kinase ATG1a [Macadamia integrifolia]|uniref:serine/threonine-protein kinase ATG1a n=1 Tax=Macadamia integrifolia TaxID=60698 RepID=UPI001C4F786F|nr:serine/threonine-protein kinase ATG1a [Macadamia integrifolia]XP_042498516.1 serine/threonine-protein kinase ATG1a [Macadamia integrifolia]
MDLGEVDRCRVIGNYILGPKIGSGSFAVVWRSRHRHLGLEVAVKEINKKHLTHKVNDNLLKEVSILSNIRHPNIICLLEVIEAADKIYLVLEYCGGGDLAAYIHRHGKVSEALARHFMRQLASGLKVLRENNLIHRDLKPQNLLLSTNEATPVLKIGDFGFARYLTPQGLADTLCGSPLYMAPEIIQNQKYDAKADLWSVGAILFQLVTGKPPFDGNNQFQLFQNILTSNELRFPHGALVEVHPDCVDLCKSLLRQNPVERLTFEEFFNHRFMAMTRPTMNVDHSSLLPEMKPPVWKTEYITDDRVPFGYDTRSQLHYGHLPNTSNINPKSTCSSGLVEGKKLLSRKDNSCKAPSSGGIEDICGLVADGSNSSDWCSLKSGSLDQQLCAISVSKVADSLETIEKDYVLVNAHFASMETLSSSLEESLQDHSAPRVFCLPKKKIAKNVAVAMQTGKLATSSSGCTESQGVHASLPFAGSNASTELRDAQGSSKLHPSTRLQLLHQYVRELSELALGKLNAGMLLESFAIELVALALWREALGLCGYWVASTAEGDSPGSSAKCMLDDTTPSQSLFSNDNIDYSSPAAVSEWAERGFIVALDRADNLSNQLRDIDGDVKMPDAMEIIFQTALAAGKRGAVDELMGDRSSAVVLYMKATLLLSFIVEEAMRLPLNPPFSLTSVDKQRIRRYIFNLQARQTNSQTLQ